MAAMIDGGGGGCATAQQCAADMAAWNASSRARRSGASVNGAAKRAALVIVSWFSLRDTIEALRQRDIAKAYRGGLVPATLAAYAQQYYGGGRRARTTAVEGVVRLAAKAGVRLSAWQVAASFTYIDYELVHRQSSGGNAFYCESHLCDKTREM